MQISRTRFAKNFLNYLEYLELISFCVANILLAAVFYLLITNFNGGIFLVTFVGSFIISSLILKNNLIILFFDKRRNSRSSAHSPSEEFSLVESGTLDSGSQPTTQQKQRANENLDIPLKNVFFAIFKQFFFNVSYELFPLLVTWISWFVFIYLLLIGVGGLTTYFNELIFHFTSNFYPVIEALGIILGVYQFYLSRQEEKVVSKIKVYIDLIGQIISRETTFEKYFEFVSEDYSISEPLRSRFLKWIRESTEPEMNYFKFFRELKDDPELLDFVRSFNFSQRRTTRPAINFQLDYKDSNEKYKYIKELGKYKTQLNDTYKKFFTSENQVEKIENIIYDDLDIKQFKILVLSNINIIQEITSNFVNIKLIKTMGESFGERTNIENQLNTCESANGYRELLERIIMQRIYLKLLE